MLERPFHFIIVVWGKAYTEHFLEYCLASLLAPGNIPSLQTRRRSKFLIATRPDDWARMKRTAIFQELERHVEAVFLEIPPCPPDVQACVHMGIGHQLACQMSFEEKAYSLVLTPDAMVSDGTVRNLQKHAENGIQLVCVAALRFAEEPFLGHLRSWGVIPKETGGDNAAPLSVSGRDMVFAAIHGMHTETLSYEWEASYFPPVPSAVWWRVPGENGILVYSLSWAPFLFDFAAVEKHDTSTLENWSIDGDYAFKNLGASPRVHVVQDSDEMFLGSWSPLDDRAIKLEPIFKSRFNWMNTVAKSQGFRAAFYGPVFDPLKRKLFFSAVRWHVNPINDRWRAVERRSRRSLVISTAKAAHPAFGADRTFGSFIWSHLSLAAFRPLIALVYLMGAIERVRVTGRWAWDNRARIWNGLVRNTPAAGDPAYTWSWRIRSAVNFVLHGRHIPPSSTNAGKN